MASQHGNESLKDEFKEFCEDNTRTEKLQETFEHDDKQQEYSIQCDEVNKRSIGKAMVKFCGNEGAANDNNQQTLRCLLQAIISHIEKEPKDTWKNAEVKIYDDNFDMYSIKAGNGKNVYMVSLDEKDEPVVIKTKQSRVSSEKKKSSCLLS